jgi:biopolymer transport protein ExbB/TolQ
MHDVATGLETLIYRFTSLLLYPSLALLVWFSLRIVWALGEAARDAWTLRRGHLRDAGCRLRALAREPVRPLADRLRTVEADPAQHHLVRRFASELQAELGHRDDTASLGPRARHLASRFEAELVRDVDRVRVLVRIGPCLGLAATLIPLGPGLAALGSGDLEKLSAQLVVAFSATVIGLGIGGIGYILAIARAHVADLAGADIEFLCELAEPPRQDDAPQPSPLDAHEAREEVSP